MTDDRISDVLRVCQEALAREGAARVAYLDTACGTDTELRREVEALLAEPSAGVPDFLDVPPWAPAAPALVVGQRLGAYEVTGRLGAGGMGEVYRARDTRLGRTVAIKVLAAGVAADPERRRRFEHEARAVSALNHPHICVLYDIGSTPATGSGPAGSPEAAGGATIDYLVMEFLEGETLARRLTKGPLPLEQVLTIATEIADALAAAHRQGVTHRDLKPGNVMLTKAGAKLLDFGLAKLKGHGEQPATARLASTPTQSEPLTGEGMIVGTLQYMAPEQVEGKPADARTDLWALGVILYEMATGRRAFEGETAASVVAAILDREPEPVRALKPLTPPAFDHVVATCLAKDPEARWQAASDVARELRWVADEARLGRTPAGGSPEAAARRTRRARLAAGGLAVVAIMAAASLTWILTRTPQPAGRPRHLWIDPRPAEHLQEGLSGAMNPLATRRPKRTAMALSPNGEMLAFVAASGEQRPRIYLRDLGHDTATQLSATEDAVSPIFSPDGRWVAYWSPSGAWMKAPIDGSSSPVKVCAAGPPFGASWAPDDTIVFAQEWGPLLAVPASGGTSRELTRIPPGSNQSHRLPHVLPDGRGVLFTVLDYAPFSAADWITARVEVLVFATGERKPLLQDAADARYLATGHLLYARRGTLEARTFDLARLLVTGGPVGVVSDVMQAVGVGNTVYETGAAQAAVSDTGTLVYLAGGAVPVADSDDFMWIDRAGRLQPTPIPPGPWIGASLSPDGRRLAFRGLGDRAGLWLYDFERSLLQNVTKVASHRWAVWTPDGRRLVHSSFENGRWMLVLKDVEGGAAPQVLAPGYAPASWSPDGRVLVFTSMWVPSASSLSLHSDIWVLRRDGATIRTEPWLQTPADERHPTLSPDGRWLAYNSIEPGERIPGQVYVQPFPGPGGRLQVSNTGGSAPLWSPDSRELFYVGQCAATPGSCLFVSFAQVGSTARFARPRQLAELPGYRTTAPLRSYDSIDGRRFLYLHRRALDTPVPPAPREMHVILNWFEELKAKVPTR